MNKIDIKVDKCPYCGHDEFGLGFQEDYARIVKSYFRFGQTPYHIICLNCGSIVRTFIENPKSFKNTL